MNHLFHLTDFFINLAVQTFYSFTCHIAKGRLSGFFLPAEKN